MLGVIMSFGNKALKNESTYLLRSWVKGYVCQ